MATDVLMPKLSDTMEEGKILKWLKQPGDRVKSGDLLAEVETDKANMEIESFDEGVVQELKVKEGDSAAVGAVIAVLGAEGEAAAPSKPGGQEGGAQ
jgi:pyruvate/2-oxoglutarate dehydrogenase complex dihydrolipoamide acyltransferase (E2) component